MILDSKFVAHAIDNQIKLRDGLLVIAPPSMMDPASVQSFFVKCTKHATKPFQVDISFQLSENVDLFLEMAEEALRAGCHDCVYERQHATTRFPMDEAEL